MDVLRACTRTAAEMCGLGTEAGAVTPGRRANLIAVGKDPLIPANLRDLRLVIKDGRVYRAGSPSPVAAAT
jgi:imidazolonepropionase-like amidohydrolase